uniref:Leucine-rich repeat-containing protein 43 n=1 Tax=Geotrypetes seraphini TaxID=260995 RepID=A0A6P8S4T4_GEOSA|nr:leucine-rich repeat-containing protein 43 [Geotrypetes seraphini]
MTQATVFAAFTDQLKALCLKEFPCGVGSWNKSRFEWRKGRLLSITGSKEKDIEAEEESPESLLELLRSSYSPWALEENWSAEAQMLRELAVTSPQLTRSSFIFRYIRSLRLVNKGVVEIDGNLLWFKNLEELVLSTNKISRVNSVNLPWTLKVLELCGNEITTLEELCVDPLPNLQHLGLAYNRLHYSSETQYFAPHVWPSLISLDLSFNNFTDLVGLVLRLSDLLQLRSLVLLGNPLALFAGYRGFIIDALPQLCALDDIRISPDEKYQYKGMAKLKDIVMNKANAVVNIRKICGLQNLSHSKENENASEFPIVTINYYLTYRFITNEPSDKVDDPVQLDEILLTSTPSIKDEISVQYPSRPSEGSSEQKPYSVPLDPLLQQTCFHSALYKTPEKSQEEVNQINYQMEHELLDVLALKSFLLRGTTVTFVEKKTLSWPVEPPVEIEVKSEPSKKGKKEKAKDAKKDTKTDDKKKKKKKKSLIEFRPDPPILRNLGSVHVSLEVLMSDPHLEIMCNFGVLYIPPVERPSTPKIKENKVKDKKSKTKRKGSAKSDKSLSSIKGKQKSKEIVDQKEVEDQPTVDNVPLTAVFQVHLLQWMTVTDALN